MNDPQTPRTAHPGENGSTIRAPETRGSTRAPSGSTPSTVGGVARASAVAPYKPRHHVRIVTSASLFDGHDAAINVMRRIMQSSGAEVIHLGHNRSVSEIVHCAIQEDVQGIAITSYQGGHVEYFKYMIDLLREAGANIKVFGGGGGTILPSEIAELHAYGVTRIYSPDDGRAMGLQGMINDLLEACDFEKRSPEFAPLLSRIAKREPATIGALITIAENFPEAGDGLRAALASLPSSRRVPVLGITGTGGAGKSSLVDELVRRFLNDFSDKTIAVLSVDPSKRKSGGALLGDRIRMNAIDDPRVYMRSLATRQSNLALSKHVRESIEICRGAGFDLIVVETSGIGQSDTEITEHADVSLYLMTAEYGAATQLEKIDMLDFADVIAINKFDKRGSLDALRDVKKQWKRNHSAFTTSDDDVPVHGTIASQFNDPGMNRLYKAIIDVIAARTDAPLASHAPTTPGMSEKRWIIPPERTRYPRRDRRDERGVRRERARRGGDRAADVPAPRHRRSAPRERREEAPRDRRADRPFRRRPRHRASRGGAGVPRRSRRSLPRPRGAPLPRVEEASGRLACHEAALRRREVPVPGARQSHRARPRLRVALAPPHPEGVAPEVRRLGRSPHVAFARKPSWAVPLHRRRLPSQARGRRPRAHVRRRGGARADEHPLPLRLARATGETPLDGVRLGDALR